MFSRECLLLEKAIPVLALVRIFGFLDPNLNSKLGFSVQLLSLIKKALTIYIVHNERVEGS